VGTARSPWPAATTGSSPNRSARAKPSSIVLIGPHGTPAATSASNHSVASPVMFPVLNPYGHVAFQAQRGDVHTVIVDGKVVKHAHRLVGIDLAAARRTVERTVEHLRSALGEDAWQQGMNPDVPETKILDNPYTYTGYHSASTHSG
jgi:hypothetical protein